MIPNTDEARKIRMEDERAITKMFVIQGIPVEDITPEMRRAAEHAVRYGRIQGIKQGRMNHDT